MTVKEFIEYAAGVGFEGVDLGYYWEDKEKEFAELPGWLNSNGIALSGYIVGNNFGLVVGTDKVREEIDKVKLAIEEADQLGARVLRVFAGGREGLRWEEGSNLICDCLAECAEYGREKNVVLALEDHGGLAATSGQVLFYIKKINSPFLRATVDIGNFWSSGGEEPAKGVKNTAPYAAMVHVKDLKKVESKLEAVPVGEGEIDFKECFKILKDAGYDGYLSLEYEAKEDAKTGIEKSIKHIKKCLSEIE
jgi:sugar phosphate isomerase/epimerase